MGTPNHFTIHKGEIVFAFRYTHQPKVTLTQRTRLSTTPCRKAWGLWVSRTSARDERTGTSRPRHGSDVARSASS